MYEYIGKKHKHPILLSSKQTQLLQLIGNLGFVNLNQLNMLWSSLLRYPTCFTRSILREWSEYGGLIKVSQKAKASTTTQTTYSLTNNAKAFLIQKNLWPASYANDPNVSINSHNEQAIEAMVQGIYAAMFKYRSLGATSIVPLRLADGAASQHGSSAAGAVPLAHKNQQSGTKKKKKTNDPVSGRHLQGTMVDAAGDAVATSSSLHNKTISINDKDGVQLSDQLLKRLEQATQNNTWTQHQLTNAVQDLLNIGAITPIANNTHRGYKNGTTNVQRQYKGITGKGLSRNTNSTLVSLYNSNNNTYNMHKMYLNDTKQGQLWYKYGTAIIHNIMARLISCNSIAPNTNLHLTWTPYLTDITINQKGLGYLSTITNSLNFWLILKLSLSDSYADSPIKAINTNQVLQSSNALEALIDPQKAPADKRTSSLHDANRIPTRQQHPSIYGKYGSYWHLNLFGSSVSLMNSCFFDSHESLLRAILAFRKTWWALLQSRLSSVQSQIKIAHTYQKLFSKQEQLARAWCLQNREKPLEQHQPAYKQELSTSSPFKAAFRKALQAIYQRQTGTSLAPTLKVTQTIQDKAQTQRTITNDDQPGYERFFGKGQKLLGRSLNLISDPNFDLKDYDFRSFNHQFGNQFASAKDLPFVADLMVSFTRHRRKHELFIELDNRSETNETQVQKTMNYVWYALAHPQKEIEMLIVTTDGSLHSRRIKQFTNVSRRLSNLVSRIDRVFVMQDSQRVYLRDLLKQATNLHVCLTGVSEAYIDIAQFLLGSDYFASYQTSLKHFLGMVNTASDWNAHFIPNSMYKTVADANILGDESQKTLQSFQNHLTKGKLRYLPKAQVNADHIWGWIEFKHKIADTTYRQPVYFGQEHDLDTALEVYQLSSQAKNHIHNFPLVFYPWRERRYTALSLPEYKEMCNWEKTYSFSQPLFIQPIWGLSNNPQLFSELRWVLIQYARPITNYFTYGALNQADLRKHYDYGNDYLNLAGLSGHPRSKGVLQKLVIKLPLSAFINQLRIDEVPLGVYKRLLDRWPQGMYAIPAIKSLPYWNNALEEQTHKIKTHYDFKDFLFSPNSTTVDARIQSKI